MNAIDQDISRGMAAASKMQTETPTPVVSGTKEATADGQLLGRG
jgi:hypothetical protein